MPLSPFPGQGITTGQNIPASFAIQQQQKVEEQQTQQVAKAEAERPVDRNAPDVVNVSVSTYTRGGEENVRYNVRANAPMAGSERTTASGSAQTGYIQRAYGQTPREYALAEAQRNVPWKNYFN